MYAIFSKTSGKFLPGRFKSFGNAQKALFAMPVMLRYGLYARQYYKKGSKSKRGFSAFSTSRSGGAKAGWLNAWKQKQPGGFRFYNA